MRLHGSRLSWIAILAVTCMISGHENAAGELRWQETKKEAVRLRLVALVWNHPRTSEFANEEVFLAEKELAPQEWKLVKLVYGFLPYQPRLSAYGLKHETIHEMRAIRDVSCDELLATLTSGEVGDWRDSRTQMQYSTDAPRINLDRQRTPLPCYQSNADDYEKAVARGTKDE
jgi:hypothetical protein